MEIYLWLCSVVFLAAFIQGLSGFGSVLITLPLLAIFIEIKKVIPLGALLGFSTGVVLLMQLRRHLEWRKVLPLIIGAVSGVPVGVYFLKRLDKEAIDWVLGILLIAYSAYGLLFKTPKSGISERWAYLFGFLSGCLGGALGASGPPVVAYTSLQAWTKDQTKVALQGFFCLSGLAVVTAHALSGVTTTMVLLFYVISLPPLTLGIYSGSYFYSSMGEEAYRRIVLLLLAILGIFTIWKAI